MSTSPSSPTSATPQQIGKAFVVQYYRLLHEHPESLHRFYSSLSTFMHDDPTKTAVGTEAIAKRIEELSLKQRHVKIRQVDCHSTVGLSVVVQVCGEISSVTVADSSAQPTMKRFVQTFVLTPADNSKQKFYVHNDIFRYQDSPTPNSTNDISRTSVTSTDDNQVTTAENVSAMTTTASSSSTTTTPTTTQNPDIPITPSAATANIQFLATQTAEKKNAEQETSSSLTTSITPPRTPVVEQEKIDENEQTSKPKSYRDAIGKKEKTPVSSIENQQTTKANKQQKKSSKNTANSANAANANSRATRGHPQDAHNYYDDSWYYGAIDESYLSTGYTDDQEVFVGNLSAQITENEIHELFRPYGSLLLVRIGNTGSQVGAANFAFVVCQSIEMAKAIVADRETLLKMKQINVEAKKRRPFPHTFRPTYPTAASPTSYQSTGYPSSFYNHSSYYEGIAARGARRGGKGGAK